MKKTYSTKQGRNIAIPEIPQPELQGNVTGEGLGTLKKAKVQKPVFFRVTAPRFQWGWVGVAVSPFMNPIPIQFRTGNKQKTIWLSHHEVSETTQRDYQRNN